MDLTYSICLELISLSMFLNLLGFWAPLDGRLEFEKGPGQLTTVCLSLTTCSIKTKPDRKYGQSRWCTFHTFFYTQTTESTCIYKNIKFIDLFAVRCSKTSLLNVSQQNPILCSYDPVKHKRAPVWLHN